MRKNALTGITFTVETDSCGTFDTGWLLAEWERMLLSGSPDVKLKRYFTFQLRRIAQLPDTPLNSTLFSQADILQLTGYLVQFTLPYLDTNVILPHAYLTNTVKSLACRKETLIQRLNSRIKNNSLRKSIENYLSLFDQKLLPRFSTLAALQYYARFLEELTATQWPAGLPEYTEEWLITELVSLNFNNIRLLKAYQETVRQKLCGLNNTDKSSLLRAERSRFSFDANILLVYDPEWPSTGQMFRSWIDEELTACTGNAVVKPNHSLLEKIGLELPVPQIALFARLLFEGGIFSKITLTGLVDQISRTFSSKNQACMSPRSLSKNCYTADQVTAAHVRGHLQQMIAFIDKNFFSLIAVISAGILFPPGR
ncbi:hypothetical protein [Mucilaginibacter sp. L3T2-6]|uniref:hypothetical protein n=1 Tax=Mucilaginibacter sp. L3T2-6 TaxID=3062491 RepID=UPI002675A631|nr:hypothetical protein [Mucilaginibacter sp. L3T2-6]MDO3641249.1 hypothetical protein [Mucilaginibacter sp. L3T2-6]MDV6213991.1 hypothetical protein [Mucilaginibacter sp. L3T2-6]